MKPNYLVTFWLFLLSAGSLLGQGGADDFFRSTGKIYSVLAVVLVLFLVLAIFLFRLDSKINKLEKQINNE